MASLVPAAARGWRQICMTWIAIDAFAPSAVTVMLVVTSFRLAPEMTPLSVSPSGRSTAMSTGWSTPETRADRSSWRRAVQACRFGLDLHRWR